VELLSISVQTVDPLIASDMLDPDTVTLKTFQALPGTIGVGDQVTRIGPHGKRA